MKQDKAVIMDLERLSRTIKTRGIEFPRGAMEELGIKKIFNSVGTLDSGGGINYDISLGKNYSDGNRVLVEKVIRSMPGKEPLVIVSAILFCSHLDMVMFVLSNVDIYHESEVLMCMKN